MAFLTIPAYHISLNRFCIVTVLGRPKMEHTITNRSEKLTLLTAREATEYLRVSLSTLNRMERRGLIRPLRTPGGHRRYTLNMLNECLSRDVQVETE
jgi:excisionase family DNA binding protein